MTPTEMREIKFRAKTFDNPETLTNKINEK